MKMLEKQDSESAWDGVQVLSMALGEWTAPETLLEGWEAAALQVFQSLERLRVSHLNLPI